MNRTFLFICAAVFSAVCCSASNYYKPQPRVIRISQKTQAVKKITVVVPESYSVADFAAAKLSHYLGQVLGQKIPVTNRVKNSDGIVLVIGDNALLRNAGLDVKKLPAEGFLIRRKGNMIFIAGMDHKKVDVRKRPPQLNYARGTLFAAYDFLERFASVRFYFPGKLGTVVPRQKTLALPEEIQIMDRPDYPFRRSDQCIYTGKKWYEKTSVYNGMKGYELQMLRNRMESRSVPICHGLRRLQYDERFASTHPEYFALQENGKRYDSRKISFGPQLCFSSNIKEEIYQDAKAFFTGKKASARGLRYWNVNAASGSVFNIQPNDWLYACACKRCIANNGVSGRRFMTEKNASSSCRAIGKQIWQMTADIGFRLKKEKIKGFVGQMSYLPYHQIPEIALPDNLLVTVALTGPWKNGKKASSLQKKDDKFLSAWHAKLKQKLMIWTYSYKRSKKFRYEALPEICPKAVGSYYKDRSKWILGGYMSGDNADSFLYSALNLYVFGKVCWNDQLSVNQILEEYYKGMFGRKASVPMKRFYETLEELWLDGVVSRTINTPLGPEIIRPTEKMIWEKIYTQKKLNILAYFIRQALKHTQGIEKERVLLIKKQILDPLIEARKNYFSQDGAFQTLSVSIPGKVVLKDCKKDETTIHTAVNITQDQKDLHFFFRCEEPAMAQIKSKVHPKDGNVWADSCVEVLLAVNEERTKYFQVTVNPAGSVFDASYVIDANGKSQRNAAWDSHAKVITQKYKDHWTARISIPKKALHIDLQKKVYANFCRTRALTGKHGDVTTCFMWTPLPRGAKFHVVERFGTLLLKGKAPVDLLKNGSFSQIRKAGKRSLPTHWSYMLNKGWDSPQKILVDRKIFVKDGASLLMRNVTGGLISTGQVVKGKADQTYKLSFFVRARNVVPQAGKRSRSGAGIYITAGKRHYKVFSPRITGDMDWRYCEYNFKTVGNGKIIIGLWNWFASGDVWFDDIRLTEVSK